VGTSYILFTAVVGFAALNTGNNALYIGLTFMLGCLLLSGIASKGGLKHLQVAVTNVGEAWAGQPVSAILRVRNDSRIWNVRDVVITSEDLAAPILVPLLARGTTTDVAAAFLFRRRGKVELKGLDLYTRYPFGFFLKKRRVRIEGEMVVFPRLLPESHELDRHRPATGEQIVANRPGPGGEIHSFRDYVRGDSLRHVYWRKSASLGRLITKQTDLEAARTVHVVVDPYKPRGASDDEFEEMISAAATFIYYAIQRHMDVVVSLPRVTLRTKIAGTAEAMFRALALLDPVYEPVAQMLERDTVVFSLQGRNAA
jgi:uncharacterized protein (DUF58 family)